MYGGGGGGGVGVGGGLKTGSHILFLYQHNDIWFPIIKWGYMQAEFHKG